MNSAPSPTDELELGQILETLVNDIDIRMNEITGQSAISKAKAALTAREARKVAEARTLLANQIEDTINEFGDQAPLVFTIIGEIIHGDKEDQQR